MCAEDDVAVAVVMEAWWRKGKRKNRNFGNLGNPNFNTTFMSVLYVDLVRRDGTWYWYHGTSTRVPGPGTWYR